MGALSSEAGARWHQRKVAHTTGNVLCCVMHMVGLQGALPQARWLLKASVASKSE